MNKLMILFFVVFCLLISILGQSANRTALSGVSTTEATNPGALGGIEKSDSTLKEPFITLGASEANRSDKNYYLTAQPIGIGPSLAVSQGLIFAKFLNPNGLVLFETTYSNYNSGFLWSYSAKKSTTFGVHYKRFVGNSLYVKGGLDQRYFSYRGSNSLFWSEEWGFDSSSTALSFALGNQWQFSNFTIGCDWIGGSIPFVRNFSNEYVSDTSSTSNAQNLESDKKSFVSDPNYQGVRLYLGASF